VYEEAGWARADVHTEEDEAGRILGRKARCELLIRQRAGPDLRGGVRQALDNAHVTQASLE
jgi:hypothetical protein